MESKMDRNDEGRMEGKSEGKAERKLDTRMESKSGKFFDEVSTKSPVNADRNNNNSRPKRERRKSTEEPESNNNNRNNEEVSPDPSAKPRRRTRNEAGNNNNNNNGGGWMDSTSSIKANRSAPIVEEEEVKTNPTNANKDKYFAEGSDEILVIPDLEEDGGDNDQRIAHAPRNVHRKIPTLQDLEAEAKNTIASTTDDGLKLQVLLSTLVPNNLIHEADIPWTFESLLREITDELSDVPKPAPVQKGAVPPPKAAKKVSAK